jgi:hypothetical protein
MVKKKSARDLKYISLEERPQPRLKFVGVDLELLSGDRFIIRVELEQFPGLTHLGTVESKGNEVERVRCSGIAAAKALRNAIGADTEKLQFLDLTAIKVFDTPAVAVSLAVHVGGDVQSLVGFCVVEEELPIRAAALAVLNAANRFLGATKVASGKFEWVFPLRSN